MILLPVCISNFHRELQFGGNFLQQIVNVLIDGINLSMYGSDRSDLLQSQGRIDTDELGFYDRTDLQTRHSCNEDVLELKDKVDEFNR